MKFRYSFEVESDGFVEALAKIKAYSGEIDCPCNLPQWAEGAASEGRELCQCVVVKVEELGVIK